MTRPLHITKISDLPDLGFDPDALALAMWRYSNPYADPLAWRQQSKPPAPRAARKRKPRTVRARPPDGLRTKAEAAAKLGCSIKTLNGHVESGALGYVIIGHGKKRPRKMFADADLDEFITNQTRKDVACPPTSPKTVARRISTTTSKCEVIGFTARRNARRAAKPKK